MVAYCVCRGVVAVAAAAAAVAKEGEYPRWDISRVLETVAASSLAAKEAMNAVELAAG